jgi:hypothetical protein
MKKRTILCALCAAFVAACASNPASIRTNVPDFVRKPPRDKEHFYGIGAAKMDSPNMSLTMAQSRARVSIAQQISSQAKSMIDDYSAQIEGGKPKNAENFSQNVSRVLSEAKLSGTEVLEQVQAPDGTWWVLVSIKKADVNKELSSSLDKEKLNYAEFKNWNAQREMESAFEKQSTRSPPVVER